MRSFVPLPALPRLTSSQQSLAPVLTVRVDAVQGSWRDYGDLVLPQGALLPKELFAGAVNLGRTKQQETA